MAERSAAQLSEHYQVEKELALRLRNAPQAERATLYRSVYDELFQRVPHHPQLSRKFEPEVVERLVNEKLVLLRRFLNRDTVFMELGPGDCRLALKIAESVRTVYAVDVSAEITKDVVSPANFSLKLSRGTDIPVPRETVTVAYSYQLMEHIHPEDAREQLRNVYEALAPGGIYVCITPNRLAGPHDISRYFDREATGFHLKEYTVGELGDLFRTVGFRKVTLSAGGAGHFAEWPLLPVTALESVVDLLPWRMRRVVANAPLIRNVLLGAVIGRK